MELLVEAAAAAPTYAKLPAPLQVLQAQANANVTKGKPVLPNGADSPEGYSNIYYTLLDTDLANAYVALAGLRWRPPGAPLPLRAGSAGELLGHDLLHV